MNIVLSAGDNMRWGGRDEADARPLQLEQPWLAQEYGRLYNIINQYGSMMMSSPALGVTSRDVVQDANDVGDYSYRDIGRISIQHLDTVIGRLSGEAEEAARERAATAADPDRPLPSGQGSLPRPQRA